jgi:hypothetical protein
MISVIAIILPSDLTNQCAQNVDIVAKIAGFFLFSNYCLYVISLNRHGGRREGPARHLPTGFLGRIKIEERRYRYLLYSSIADTVGRSVKIILNGLNLGL